MSVYTLVTHDALQQWLVSYPLGQLLTYQGIAAGVTNTNYLVSTTHGRYILTLFETLTLDKLPFYLYLMNHLSQHNIACPAPIADHSNQFASILAGKPACLTSFLDGQHITQPTAKQCYTVGKMLAEMHRVGTLYPYKMKNPRGLEWCSQIAATLYPYMSLADRQSLSIEVKHQHSQRQHASLLPTGIVHADLFKDNVLINGDSIAGFIDFYYACHDILLYDVAIAINDWACSQSDGNIDDTLALAFLNGYQSARPFSDAEKQAWPTLLRTAALRFWISRLLDVYQPQPSELTYIKDPKVFQRLAEAHRQRVNFWL